MLYHQATFGWAKPEFRAQGTDRAFPFLEVFANTGWIGVQVFFVLSGFIISASANNGSCWDFLRRRAVRVFPTLWICATIALAIRLLAGEEATELLMDYARSVVLFPKGPYIDGVIWTLVVEAVFYAIVASGIFLAGKELNRQIIFDGIAIRLGLVSSFFLLLEAISPLISPAFNELMSKYFFTVFLLRHGVFFALGMLIWSTLGQPVNTVRKIGWCHLFGLFCLLQIGIRSGGLVDMILPAMFWVLCLCFVIASIRWNDLINSTAALASIKFIGLMTYPLYLIHFTLGTYFTPIIFNKFGHDQYVNWLVLTLATLAFSGFITSSLEPRGQKALRRVLMT
ncbi:acyltransferase family protein [Roseibium sp.]|uniref:acyltransferase family protein n=1 Tax=Roseibium sp. TaxID=1936156 RepID=UPI003B51433D